MDEEDWSPDVSFGEDEGSEYHTSSHSRKKEAPLPFQRGVREQLFLDRAKQLKELSDAIIYSLLGKTAGSASQLDEEERAGWDALQRALTTSFQGLQPPYLISKDQAQAYIARLSSQDASLGMLAIHYANLSAFTRALIVLRNAAKADRPFDESASRQLVQCADVIAAQRSPFSIVKDADLLASLIVGLRAQAALLSAPESREARFEDLFGNEAIFPPTCQNIGRTASKVVRDELQRSVVEGPRRSAYPYDRMLANGLSFARTVFEGIAQLDTAARPLPPVAKTTMIYFPKQSQQIDKETQINALFAAAQQQHSAPSSSPWQAQSNAPILSAQTHRALANLTGDALRNLLDPYRAAVDTVDFTMEGSSSGSAQPSRLRFGPGGLQMVNARPFSLLRSNLFDTQPTAERITFESQSRTGRKQKRAAKTKKRKEADALDLQDPLFDVEPDDKAKSKSKQEDRRMWTAEEEELLKRELKQYYNTPACWATIMQRHGPEGTESRVLAHRANVSLKDKARNLRLQYERRDQEPPIWLSAVSGNRRRSAVASRDERGEIIHASPRPLSVREQLEQKRTLEAAMAGINGDH